MQFTTLPAWDATCRTGTEDICLGVSSLFFIPRVCGYRQWRICSIVDTA